MPRELPEGVETWIVPRYELDVISETTTEDTREVLDVFDLPKIEDVVEEKMRERLLSEAYKAFDGSPSLFNSFNQIIDAVIPPPGS